MASNITMTGSSYGQGMDITDKRWTPTDVVNPIAVAEFTATQDIRTMDAYLTTANAAYWTQARKDQENVWDKLFWIRSQTANGGALA